MGDEDWSPDKAMDQDFIDRTISVAVIMIGGLVLAGVMLVAWAVL